MKIPFKQYQRRFIIPEVVQTSAMDCGPASLKCLLEGFRIPVSYGRLREACQTDVDGTSIDTLEEVAGKLGLIAEQIMVPVDHLFIPAANALPAIVVVRLPDGYTHFVVAWRNHGRFVQVMDPATGRRFPMMNRFLNEIFVHTFPVPASDWRQWAGSDEFILPLTQRMQKIIPDVNVVGELIEKSMNDPGWQSLAALDAATRLVNSIVQSGGAKAGKQSASILKHFFDRAVQNISQHSNIIHDDYWTVKPISNQPDEEQQLLLRGAVLVRALRRSSEPPILQKVDQAIEEKKEPQLSPELRAALEAPKINPLREMFNFLKLESHGAIALLLVSLLLSAGLVLLEALIFRSVIEWGQMLKTNRQLLGGMAMVAIFAAGLLLLDLARGSGFVRLGRHLEIRLRTAFLEKLPKLGDRYFRSRPVSDMAHRGHLLHLLRILPDLGSNFFITVFEIMITMIGIIWIAPDYALPAVLAAVLSITIPLASLPILNERDMRLQTHNGALSKFYLDSLLGLVAVKTHSAEESVRREHEALVVEWARSGIGFHGIMVIIEGFQTLIGFGLAAWILFGYLKTNAETSWILLLVYWALNLPVLGQFLVTIVQQFPMHRNTAIRLMEPLGAPEEERTTGTVNEIYDLDANKRDQIKKGMAISLESVNVVISGHPVLQNLNMEIEPGEHIAIVGKSGAGKSTFVGIFLGWNRTASGQLRIDDKLANQSVIEKLRQETVWIDSAVQIWNRSLYENLTYGSLNETNSSMEDVLEEANLFQVLQNLPDGLQSKLGENGGLVSGGEGQRVRIGRAIYKSNPRLAILDEPFSGLERNQRRELLARLRQRWHNTTLLCVTHDILDTLTFDRIVVMEHGQILENGAPAELAERKTSAYHRMLEADRIAWDSLWSDQQWRKLWLEKGKLSEKTESLDSDNSLLATSYQVKTGLGLFHKSDQNDKNEEFNNRIQCHG